MLGSEDDHTARKAESVLYAGQRLGLGLGYSMETIVAYIQAKFAVHLQHIRWATLGHASGSGVQLSAGIAMEAYADQTAATNEQFFTSLRRSQAGNQVIPTRVAQPAA